MVGVRRSTATTNSKMEFFKLEETGAGDVKEILTSAWARKEDSGEGAGSEGSGSKGGGRAGTGSWSEDEIPLKGVRAKKEVKGGTRGDTGGALSPV